MIPPPKTFVISYTLLSKVTPILFEYGENEQAQTLLLYRKYSYISWKYYK